MGHWSDDMRRADADEIASALGLDLEYDAEDGIGSLKAHAEAMASEHAALRQQVEELRYGAASWHKAAQRGADEERGRCRAWVLYAEACGHSHAVAVAGIDSGKWPPAWEE